MESLERSGVNDIKTSILRESFYTNLSVISSQHPANHSSCSPGLLFVMGTLANIPVPHLLYRWFEHSPAPLETALWGCDFCPASCLEVPREAKKYRAEFLGTYFAFGLVQGSELCIGCRRKRVAQTFLCPAGQGRTGVSVGTEPGVVMNSPLSTGVDNSAAE